MLKPVKRKRVLSVFSLVMINVIAVDSLRSLPISAEYGFAVILLYILAAIFFFIPTALVAAELATGWPKTGGLYVWVKEAFGKRWGLVTIWMQWIYNIVWYPTILSFIAATLAYLINPALAENKYYLLPIVIGSFWAATIANCFGMKVSSFISSVGALFGTIIPMLTIAGLGILWWYLGKPLQIDASWHNFTPKIDSFNDLAFITALLFGLIGMEMSAVHAEDVKDPQRNYPKALLYSTIIIIFSLALASLAIAMVVPHKDLSLVTGLIEAYRVFFSALHIEWMTPVIAILIIVGGLSGVSTWVIGPTKGLLAATEDGCLPEFFAYTNKRGAPVILLLIQAVIFTLLCSVFLTMPTVNSSYWILSALTAQLAMIVYLFMFTAVIKLRQSQPEKERAFKIPGGIIGVCVVAIFGLLASLFAIVIGFFPATGIQIDSVFDYELFLIVGIVVFTVAPLLLYRDRSPPPSSQP